MYLYIFMLVCITWQERDVNASEAERKLIRYLFNKSRYNKLVRPVEYDDQAVNLTFNLVLYQLIEINEKAQIIELSAFIQQKWTDSQLRWNPYDYNNISEINLPPDKLWLPDVVLHNNVDDSNAEYGGSMDTLRTRVIVGSSGFVLWLAPIIIKASCKIDIREFPFDTQHCFLKFSSWTFDMVTLDIKTDGVVTGGYMQNLEWNLIKTEGIRSEVKYNCCLNKYPDVTFHLYFQRRSLFYVINLIFPIAVITVLTIIAFVLPAESGERLSLAVTLMLATTVFTLLVAETTPDSSESVPIVSIYFIMCMIMMFLIIVFLCFTSTLYSKTRTDKPMGEWTRRFIFDKLSYVVRIRVAADRCSKTNAVESLAKSGMSVNNGLAFANHRDNGDNKFYVNGDKHVSSRPVSVLRKLSMSSSMDSEDMRKLELIIDEIERNHGRTYNGGNEGDGDFSFEEEWRVVAMTIDRCLFITFIIGFIVGTVVCFSDTTYVN